MFHSIRGSAYFILSQFVISQVVSTAGIEHMLEWNRSDRKHIPFEYIILEFGLFVDPAYSSDFFGPLG